MRRLEGPWSWSRMAQAFIDCESLFDLESKFSVPLFDFLKEKLS
jgi:hypothetical protein